jgi:hypothetical protein
MTALLILGNTATLAMSRRAFRFAFWIGLGSAVALLSRVIGLRVETTALILVLALVVVGLFLRDGRTDLRRLLAAMAEGAKAALGVGVACALVGTLIGVCTLTGVASDLARMVLGVAENNMLLALIMTMVACLVLGTGLPTIPTYIITSATVAPALLQLGVPLIVSHMFCFYFGIMADLTPPVALAALAAQAIANASHMKIGFIATRIALAGYVIPFMTVYSAGSDAAGRHLARHRVRGWQGGAGNHAVGRRRDRLAVRSDGVGRTGAGDGGRLPTRRRGSAHQRGGVRVGDRRSRRALPAQPTARDEGARLMPVCIAVAGALLAAMATEASVSSDHSVGATSLAAHTHPPRRTPVVHRRDEIIYRLQVVQPLNRWRRTRPTLSAPFSASPEPDGPTIMADSSRVLDRYPVGRANGWAPSQAGNRMTIIAIWKDG